MKLALTMSRTMALDQTSRFNTWQPNSMEFWMLTSNHFFFVLQTSRAWKLVIVYWFRALFWNYFRLSNFLIYFPINGGVEHSRGTRTCVCWLVLKSHGRVSTHRQLNISDYMKFDIFYPSVPYESTHYWWNKVQTADNLTENTSKFC